MIFKVFFYENWFIILATKSLAVSTKIRISKLEFVFQRTILSCQFSNFVKRLVIMLDSCHEKHPLYLLQSVPQYLYFSFFWKNLFKTPMRSKCYEFTTLCSITKKYRSTAWIISYMTNCNFCTIQFKLLVVLRASKNAFGIAISEPFEIYHGT